MSKRLRRKALLLCAIAVVAFLCLVIILDAGSETLTATTYHLSTDRITGSLTIVQLSDLHSRQFGEGNRDLLRLIEEQDPDLIADTGDTIFGGSKDISFLDPLEEGLSRIAPVFFVTGNHEYKSGMKNEILSVLEKYRVTVLHGEIKTLTVRGNAVAVGGIDDVRYVRTEPTGVLSALETAKGYPVLLMHEPQTFAKVADYDIPLTLSGHTHGGQIELPFIGVLYVPNQFPPRFVSGLYTLKSNQMVVSQGLGNSALPVRINCPPEITVIKIAGK